MNSLLFYGNVCLKNTNHVPHQKTESIFGRDTKICAFDCTHYVSIPIDESHKFLKTPETAFAYTEQAFGQIIVVFTQCLLNAVKNGLNKTYDSNN